MADDRFSRPYRPSAPPRRDPRASAPSAQPEGDPLAELARLIGQSDPFAEFGRGAPAPDPRHADPRHIDPRAPAHRETYREPPFTAPEPRRPPMSAYETMQYPAHDTAMRSEPADPHWSTAPGRFADDVHYGHEALDTMPAVPHAAGYGAADTVETESHYADPRRDPHDSRADHFRHDEPFAGHGQDDGQPPHFGGNYHPPAGQIGLRDEAIYDDPPRVHRRSGLFAAALLIGCAVVGTAAAYGYRTYSVGRTAQAPPVITADTAPSKVMAAA